MTKEERKQWDYWVNMITTAPGGLYDADMMHTMYIANRHILQLERELQNLKRGNRIAAILKSQKED